MLKALRLLISPAEENNGGWDDVGIALPALKEAISAYRELPPVVPCTPRPSVAHKSSTEVIWEIPLFEGRTCFMSAQRTNYLNEEQFVVFVCANDFYALWRAVDCLKKKNTTNRPPKLEDIPFDRKWRWQAQCWAHGQSNPVPLAQVSYHPDYGIGFIDGITRTLWLLHNKAPIFPVLVRGQKNALGLFEISGDKHMTCESIESLTKELDYSNNGRH